MPELRTETSGGDPDALAHLYKMSTTAGAFGTQEYVAINGVSIAALLFALAGPLALLIDTLIVLPVAGVVCGFVALRQIRQSNGTQTGAGFAILGLVLSLAITGAVIGLKIVHSVQVRNAERQSAALITEFGQLLGKEHYDTIYDSLMSDAFRHRIDRATFKAGLAQLQDIPNYGPIVGAEWNGESMVFQNVGDSGAKLGTAMALIKYQKSPDPSRQYLDFTNREGDWKVDNFPQLFVQKKKKSG